VVRPFTPATFPLCARQVGFSRGRGCGPPGEGGYYGAGAVSRNLDLWLVAKHGTMGDNIPMTQSETVPMPSVRIHAGKYHVLGTSRECIVEKAVGGRWCLDVDGEFHKAFDTKREALQYVQRHVEL
jgi:hypothetical protein